MVFTVIAPKDRSHGMSGAVVVAEMFDTSMAVVPVAGWAQDIAAA